jgi:hypothetical protein
MLDYGTCLAIAAATFLVSSTLPAGPIQKAEAATINITQNTKWTTMTIKAPDVANISSGATLTITGVVDDFGTINVNDGGSLGIFRDYLIKIPSNIAMFLARITFLGSYRIPYSSQNCYMFVQP